NHLVARFDVEGIPVVFHFVTGLGRIEEVNAAGRIPVPGAAENLYLVADVRGGLLGVPGGPDGKLPARRVANGDAAVASGAGPPLQVQIELTVVVLPG